MIINDVQFNTTLEEVFEELQEQIQIRGFQFFSKGYRDSGNDIMVQCPYHREGQERKPSAGIRKSDGQFHCFTCGEVHSLPEVISYCFGYDDTLGKDGWKWLLKNFATIQVEERKDVALDFYRSDKHSISNDCSHYVSEEELDRYRYYHSYWKKRGIVDDEIIELFDLGYDKANNSITFPVRDISGNCLFVARRSVVSKFFNYPKGVEKPLYGLYELHESFWCQFEGPNDYSYGAWELFVTESMIDCILLWQAGFYAVALNGTGNELQFKQLRDLPCRKLILATDNDEAGQKARKRIKQNIKNKLMTEIEFPPAIKDVGECNEQQQKNIKNWEVF